MVGKIPGVNVVSSGGAPARALRSEIRSGASLSASNDPLFVIDGVPVDNSTIEEAPTFWPVSTPRTSKVSLS